MKSNPSYDRAMRHISRALHFGTLPMSDIPDNFKMMLVKQPSLASPEFIMKISALNSEFRLLLREARQLYLSWVHNFLNRWTITDNEVHQALSFSSQLFCYAPARIQENAHVVRDVLKGDPDALRRCVTVLSEIDALYHASHNKDTFIRERFLEVFPNRFMIDRNYKGRDGNIGVPAHQALHSKTHYDWWGTPSPMRWEYPVNPALYGDEVLDNYDPLPCKQLGDGLQVYHYRPTKYEFFKRKEKIRRMVNKYYMERQIADLDANNQETFLHWHAQLRNMQDIEITIRTYSIGIPTCYEKEYIYQLILSPIERNVENVLRTTRFGVYRSQESTKCVRIIMTASLEGTWTSEHHKQSTHHNMQKILQDTASLARVMVGDPHLANHSQTQNIEPTQLQLQLIMEGQVYGQIADHDQWFNR